MLVGASGRLIGSVGGGCVEAEVIEAALEAQRRRAPALLTHHLNADLAGDLGLSCGGTVDIFVEPLIAASIIYVGVENIFRRDLEKRWMLAFGFGLIHGCGFATVLRDLGVGKEGAGVVMPLLSFNLGVELGQLAIAALVLPIVWALKKRPVYQPRFVPALSVLIIAAGAYWLVERLVQIGVVSYLFTLTTNVMPFVLFCATFTFLYKVIPYTTVRFTSALIGGACAGILWQVVGMAFAAFVANSARYAAIYSSFAIMMVFLIWLYVGWLIFLIGYLPFFLVAFWVYDMRNLRKQILTVGSILGFDLICLLLFGVVLRWI